jgi:hypothetical protein
MHFEMMAQNGELVPSFLVEYFKIDAIIRA